MVLALLDHPEFGEAVVYACNAEYYRKVAGGQAQAAAYFAEAAGRAFFERFEHQEEESSGSAASSKQQEESEDEFEESPKAKAGKSGGYLKISALLKDVKLYQLMGVSEGASQDDIKKAYRGLALSCHPDKLAAMDEKEAKEIQERFVQIQEAYELLSDPEKRMLYDSSLEFDGSLPKFKPSTGQDFYEVFDEVFKRNARWSTKKPVPEIGGPETPMAQVTKFYDFWYSFQTWRDPVAMAQAEGEELEDLDQAECREEKRWMMRENARIAKKYAKAEKERITALTAMAEKYDPRILAEKESKKAARAAEAARREEERNAVKRAKEDEERKLREAEEARLAAEAEQKKQQKAAKEAAKLELKKRRQRLRALHPAVKDFVVLEQLNEVCFHEDCEALDKLCGSLDAALEESQEAAVKIMHEAIESLGLKPLIPEPEEDDRSTTDDGNSEENSCPSTPEKAAEKLREEEEKRKKEEQRRKDAAEKKALEGARKKQEAEQAAALAAEAKKRREEQRKKEEQAAEAKRKQQEKKEREKAKKEEEKLRKQEEQEQQRREQQREEAKQKALEQAERDRVAAANEEAEREDQRVQKLFLDDRMERLALYDGLSAEAMLAELQAKLEEDASLRGSLGLLQKAAVDVEQKQDCLMTLLSYAGPFWQLGLEPPADVKPLDSAVRNKAKKARTQLRTVAQKLFNSLPGKYAAADAKEVTEYQKGMVDGLYEWRVWSLEEREAELAARNSQASAETVVETEVETASPTPSPAGGKKAKKGSKQPKEEEDLDALLNEFGVTVVEDKKKSKKRK